MASLVLGLLLFLASGQSINFFSPKQDVEIGTESAKDAEQSVSLVATASLPHRYVTTIGRRLVQNRSLPVLNYRFRIVNSKDINSVGFPGGAIYINRGLLEIASTDDDNDEVAFINAIRGQSKDTWDTRLTAKAVVNYIRAGFGLSQIT